MAYRSRDFSKLQCYATCLTLGIGFFYILKFLLFSVLPMFIVSQFKLKVFLIFFWKEVELIFSGFIKKTQEVMRENYIPMYYQICILLVYLITLQIFDHQVDDMMRKFFCWSRLLRKSCTYIIHRYLYCKYMIWQLILSF